MRLSKYYNLFGKLYRANIFPALMLMKFGFLFLYGLLIKDTPDLFGQYTLAIGLTNSFYIFSGMRARFYVLKDISTAPRLVELMISMGVMGLLASAIVYFLNADEPTLALIMIVGLAKFAETFLDAGTSFLQQKVGREESFKLLNQHGYLVAIIFILLVPVGLKYAVASEAVLLVITVLRQQHRIGVVKSDVALVRLRSMAGVTLGGLVFTISAVLNSAQMTLILYHAQDVFERPSALALAKVFAAQAIFARLITGNNIYFRNALENLLQAIARRLSKFVGCMTVIFLGVYAAQLYWSVPFIISIYIFGALFTIVNVLQIVIRQHIMISDGVAWLIRVHTVELVILGGVLLATNFNALDILLFFTMLRLVRVGLLPKGRFDGGVQA